MASAPPLDMSSSASTGQDIESAEKSDLTPFVSEPGNILVHTKAVGPISPRTTIDEMLNGKRVLSDRAVAITRLLYVWRVLSKAQIARLYFFNVSREKSIRESLRHWVNSGVVNPIGWGETDGQSRFSQDTPCYTLGRAGWGYLLAYAGVVEKDSRRVVVHSAATLWRILLANEFASKLKAASTATKGLRRYELFPVVDLGDGRTMRPTATFEFVGDNRVESFHIQVIRGVADVRGTVTKLQIYHRMATILKRKGKDESAVPTILFFVENEDHALWIAGQMRRHRLVLPVYFSTDVRINQKQVDEPGAFFVVGKDGDKYGVKELTAGVFRTVSEETSYAASFGGKTASVGQGEG